MPVASGISPLILSSVQEVPTPLQSHIVAVGSPVHCNTPAGVAFAGTQATQLLTFDAARPRSRGSIARFKCCRPT